ncbi:MAG: hypothetical protein MUC96_16755 [Myxococcaceae bacterium]|jgi:hypothetical protein|nr:hypothetical protein [Myxococcaceae bacterium]
MSRSFLFVAALVSLSACGPADLSSRITIGDEAKIVRKGQGWVLTAPVQVFLPATRGGWRLTTSVAEKSLTGFLNSGLNTAEFPASATTFEVPLQTRREPKSGDRVTLELIVAAHVWDGALGTDFDTANKTFNFDFQ